MAVAGNEVIRSHAAFVWSVADLSRGDYKPHELRPGERACRQASKVPAGQRCDVRADI